MPVMVTGLSANGAMAARVIAWSEQEDMSTVSPCSLPEAWETEPETWETELEAWETESEAWETEPEAWEAVSEPASADFTPADSAQAAGPVMQMPSFVRVTRQPIFSRMFKNSVSPCRECSGTPSTMTLQPDRAARA